MKRVECVRVRPEPRIAEMELTRGHLHPSRSATADATELSVSTTPQWYSFGSGLLRPLRRAEQQSAGLQSTLDYNTHCTYIRGAPAARHGLPGMLLQTKAKHSKVRTTCMQLQ